MRSRLSTKMKSQSIHTTILSIAGIAVILFLIIKFGIPVMVDSTLFISGMGKTKQAPVVSSAPSFIAPPVLDALPSATNSATIPISGTGQKNQKINLYINGSLVDTANVQDDNKFSFDSETLTTGDNLIQTKATMQGNDKESDFSNQFTVTYIKNAPSLTIDSPSDGQTFSKDDNTADVKGKTDPGVKVTVNGFWAIVDTDGAYSYTLPLNGGQNKITVIATDPANNKTEKNITVNHNQ